MVTSGLSNIFAKPNLQNPDTRLGRSNLCRRLRTRFRHEFLHELNQRVRVSFRDSIIEGCTDAYLCIGIDECRSNCGGMECLHTSDRPIYCHRNSAADVKKSSKVSTLQNLLPMTLYDLHTRLLRAFK